MVMALHALKTFLELDHTAEDLLVVTGDDFLLVPGTANIQFVHIFNIMKQVGEALSAVRLSSMIQDDSSSGEN